MAAQPNQITNNNSSPSLEEFVDRLILEKDYPESITTQMKQEMKTELLSLLNKTINVKILAQLSSTDTNNFEKMIKEDRSPAEIQDFVKNKIPDFEAFLAGVLLNFRNKYLGLG